MKEKITFFITSNSTGRMKKLTISKNLFKSLVCCIIIVIAAWAFLMMDYFSLRQRHVDLASDGNSASRQGKSAEHLWDQIKKLDYDINWLKSKLARMYVLEEKLRLLAKEDFGAAANLNGIGGPLPEDVDPKSEIKKMPGEFLSEMRQEMGQLQQTSIDQEKKFENLLDLLGRQREIFSYTPTGRPVPGHISSGYGWRQSPFNDRREFHSGMDIASYYGSPIKSPADGIVIDVERKGGLGKVLVIDHGNGVITRYGHLSMAEKKPGDRVKRGEVIARVGTTGRTTGPHLHYEIIVGGTPVDPKKFM